MAWFPAHANVGGAFSEALSPDSDRRRLTLPKLKEALLQVMHLLSAIF